MKLNIILGWILFVLSSLLYTLNQNLQFLVFANFASQIIFVLLCFAGITLGIALVVFDEAFKQASIGFVSIIITTLLLTAILLVYDSFTHFTYESYEYFVLLQIGSDLSLSTDEVALMLVNVAPSLGILSWMLVSRTDLKKFHWIALFDLIMLIEAVTMTAIINI